MTATNKAILLIVAAVVGAQASLPVSATTFNASVSKNHKAKKTTSTAKIGTYWQRHPKVKSAAIGAGVGTAAGAVTGLVTHRGIVHGAAIGAGTGAGVGLIHSSSTMKRHPIVKDTATGGAVGLGLGLSGGRGHHPGIKAAAVGGAVGLGVGLIKNGLK